MRWYGSDGDVVAKLVSGGLIVVTARENHQFGDVLDELLLGGQIARGSWPKGMRLDIEDDSPTISVCGRAPGSSPWVPRADDLGANDWIIVTDREDLNDAA